MDGYLPAGGFLFGRLPSALSMRFDHDSKILSDNEKDLFFFFFP